MNNLTVKLLALFLFGFSAELALAQSATPAACLTKFGQKEWTILLKDLDPTVKKNLLEDKEQLRLQTENLRQLFAFSCEALKRGFGRDVANANELGFIRSETFAVSYDRRSAKTKPGIPFEHITDAQIAQFYSVKGRAADFDRFLNTKIDIIRRANPAMADKAITEEEKQQAKDFYAKIKISERSAVLLGEPFRSSTELKVRLHQAQFLARLVSEKIAGELHVGDDEVAKYISEHPELDPSAKKAKAQKILDRARAGEDFAALANEFTEDPGNAGENGNKNGGLYKDVPVGMMVPPFEKAALSLEPGKISGLVETDFGFHVIKLERKSADGSVYDVRHILISTGYKDPDDPDAKEVPPATFVRSKLEGDREAVIIDRIVAENPIAIEDYKPPVKPAARPVIKKKR